MSDREALVQLQSRLAERLQAARTEPRSASWLAVECAGRGLLFPLAAAGEIFPLSALQTVPHTRPWFAGVANLRGSLHGVVDLASFLGLRERAPDNFREPPRLVALSPSVAPNCALLVDRLAGLRAASHLERDDADDAAAGALRPAFAGARWRDAEGRVWQEIDLAALALHEQFLAIAA